MGRLLHLGHALVEPRQHPVQGLPHLPQLILTFQLDLDGEVAAGGLLGLRHNLHERLRDEAGQKVANPERQKARDGDRTHDEHRRSSIRVLGSLCGVFHQVKLGFAKLAHAGFDVTGQGISLDQGHLGFRRPRTLREFKDLLLLGTETLEQFLDFRCLVVLLGLMDAFPIFPEGLREVGVMGLHVLDALFQARHIKRALQHSSGDLQRELIHL